METWRAGRTRAVGWGAEASAGAASSSAARAAETMRGGILHREPCARTLSACPACDAAFETLIMRKSDELEVTCPTCGSGKVERQLSRPAASRGGRGGGA